MSFECDGCHVIATGKSGFDVHFRTMSRGRCETCGFTRDCFECQCSGDWAAARHAANPPAEGRTLNDAPTRYALWVSEAKNPLAIKIARIMSEGRYDQVYDEGPEFHYAIAAALRSPTEEMTLRSLISTFANLQRSHRKLIDLQVLTAMSGPPPIIVIRDKTVDEPQST